MRWCAFLLLASALDAQELPYSPLPVDHWTYLYLERLLDRGHLPELPVSFRPWNRYEIAGALTRIDRSKLGDGEVHWLKLLEQEFRSELQSVDTSARFRLGLDAGTGFQRREGRSDKDGRLDLSVEYTMSNFSGYARGRIDNSLKDDPLYTGRKTDWFGARMEDAFGMAHGKKLYVWIGRFGENWGPFPDQSLILSAHSYTYDKLGFGFRGRRMTFRSVFSQLDDVQGARRFLAAHRIDFRVTRSLHIGLSESVVYGGPGQDWDLTYSNPFTIFADAQHNEQKEANENVALDVLWRSTRVVARFQFLIDDLILDGPSQPAPNRKTSPDRLASLTSITLNDVPVPSSELEFSYFRAGTHTYNVKSKRPWQSYTFRSRGLGAPRNDGDAFRARFSYFRWAPAMLITEAGFTRQGERSLLSNDFEDSTFVKASSFPSGTASTMISLDQFVRYQPSGAYSVEGSVGWGHVRNYRFDKKDSRNFIHAMIRLQVIFRQTRNGY